MVMAVGRQREFDEQVALDAAMKVFWKNGYSGTSLTDLTQAMGINKPSLYAAFGNKEALFIRSLTHYVEKHGYPHAEKLKAENAPLSERLKAFLESITEMLCDPALPGGCFVAETTSESGGQCLPEAAAQVVSKINHQSRTFFVDFFRQEAMAGNLIDTNSVDVFADYLMTLQYGLAVMARNGAEKDALIRVIGLATRVIVR